MDLKGLSRIADSKKVDDEKRPRPSQKAKIKDSELSEEQLNEIFDDPGDEFFNKIMNETGADDLENDCDADGYMVELDYFDGEIVKRYGQDPENMWTIDGDLKKWANASLERACKRFKKEMLRVAKKCNAAVLLRVDDPTERVYAKFVDPRLVEPYELKPTWKPGDAPIKDERVRDSRVRYNVRRKIKDSVNTEFLQEFVDIYNEIQNNEDIDKNEALNKVKGVLEKLGCKCDVELVDEDGSWYILWGSSNPDLILGFDCSSELWQAIYELDPSADYEIDVTGPENPGFGAERFWDEYRDTIGKADKDITVIYGPWGSSNPTEIVVCDGDVSKFLEDEGAVFVPKDQYFHSSGEMCDITLIGGEEDLKKYLEDFEDPESGEED